MDETAGNGAAQGAAKRLEVAVGVVVRRDGRVLLGQRVAGKPYAGWWEFPGGKIEAGETVAQALARELHEELGLVVRASHPWLIREFQYPHAHVRLHFRRIVGAWDDFSGEPQSREGQAFDWLSLDNPARTPLLPASEPVFGWLRLPAVIGRWNPLAQPAGGPIRPVDAPGLPMAGPGVSSLSLLEMPGQPPAGADPDVCSAIVARRAGGGRLVASSNHPPAYAQAADGVLFEAAALRALTARPPLACCGARCETAADLAQAARLGLDFVVASAIDTGTALPLYRDDVRLAPDVALRGLREAIASGAHGIVLAG